MRGVHGGARSRFYRTVLLLAALAVLTASCRAAPDIDGAAEDGGFSVASSLAQIPMSVTQGELTFDLSMADVDAAADIARIRRPAQLDDAEQAIDFLRPLSGFTERPSRVYVSWPRIFARTGQFPAEWIEEFGFTAAEVQSFVDYQAPPIQFVVLAGVTPRAGLPEVAPGVVTVGEGEDRSIDVENRTVVRELGRPFRIGIRGDRVALGLDTAPVLAWAENAELRTLADDPRLLAMAELLDERRVVSATISTFKGEADYTAVALGWGEDDAGPFGVIVLSYLAKVAAAEDLGAVTESFDGSTSDGVPMSDLVILESIEQLDSEIVAVVRFPAESRPATIFEMFLRQDGPFAP